MAAGANRRALPGVDHALQRFFGILRAQA